MYGQVLPSPRWRSRPVARARDYSAEYARRTARAKALGYKGYWQARQTKLDDTRRAEQAAKRRHRDRLRRLRWLARLQSWSDNHSARDVSRYDPLWPLWKKRAYDRAWIGKGWEPGKPGSANIDQVRRGKGDRVAVEHWLIDVTGHYTVSDFDRRYPAGTSNPSRSEVSYGQTSLF